MPPTARATVGKIVDFIIWKIEWFSVLYLNSKFHENSLDVKHWKMTIFIQGTLESMNTILDIHYLWIGSLNPAQRE